MRTKVSQLEQGRAALLQLRARKLETAGLLDIWQDVTRTLPVHSWITELRLTENEARQIAMSGFSTDASSLVGLFDKSTLFVDASFTAPITRDPIEGKERFSLQAKFRTLDRGKPSQ